MHEQVGHSVDVPDTPERIAINLADNVRALREARGLSQQQMAHIAGVPRPTWAHLESGAANPTVTVLVRVADALQVRVEELIGPPRSAARLYSAGSLPDPVAGLSLERMELPPGAAMTGIPHTAGTREYLTCETGEIELSAAGQTWRLGPGDVVVFRGDQKHGYRNPGRATTIAYSVIAFAPSAG
jgi:transcriptional regulator with XRE-family HTH domain